jgi:hypothetical protein
VAPGGSLLLYLMLYLLGNHHIVYSFLLEICVHLVATKWFDFFLLEICVHLVATKWFDLFLLEIYLHLVVTKWLNVLLFEVIST